MNFMTQNHLNIQKLKMSQIMRNFNEQFLYSMYYIHVKLQLEEHFEYMWQSSVLDLGPRDLL